MLNHPSEYNPYGEFEVLTRREKLFNLIDWFFNTPLLWLITGAGIASVSNMLLVVDPINALDKVLVCK